MSADAGVLMLLMACCITLAALQAVEWPRPLQAAMTLAVVAALVASGEAASRTSTAELLHWAALPQRRQDLAALLLAESLLFGSVAVRQAQGALTGVLRWLGWLPLPTALLALFAAQVSVMLWVDGWDYATLSWWCAVGFAALLVAAAALLRRALPHLDTRCALRVGLHAAQAVAGLWLARPALHPVSDPVPFWGERLATVAAVVLVLACAGWALQRRR